MSLKKKVWKQDSSIRRGTRSDEDKDRKKIRPYHLAFIEQNMKSREDDECIRAYMRKIIELVEGSMDYSRPDVPEDHPPLSVL